MNLHLEIITPEKVVYKDEVNEVTVPTVNGQISILPNHVGLLTQVAPGEITIQRQGKEYFLAVTGGFLEVGKNNVTILADYAVRSEEIELAKAEAAQKKAKQIMEEKVSEKDFAIAESQLRRSLLEIKVAQRRKTRASLPPSA